MADKREEAKQKFDELMQLFDRVGSVEYRVYSALREIDTTNAGSTKPQSSYLDDTRLVVDMRIEGHAK